MSPLAIATLLLAGLALVLGLPPILFPAGAAAAWKRFPRNVWAGRVLSAVALFWAAAQLADMPIEFLAPYRGLILPLTPVVVLLTWIWMDELLACRAAGALLALIPAPLLSCVRVNDSPARIVIAVLAYMMVIDGMLLMACPYLLRDGIAFLGRSQARVRATGIGYTALAVALVALALFVY